MTILHLGHQVTDLTGVTGLISTDAAGFDADLDVNGIKVTSSRTVAVPFSARWGAPSGDVSLGFRFRSPSVDAAITTGAANFLEFYDAADALVARVRASSAYPGYEAIADGDTGVGAGAYWVPAAATAYWLDVVIAVGANVTINFYADGVLIGTAVAANTGAKGRPVRCVWNNQNLTMTSATWYYAHIAVLDGVSTVGRRFARRLPGAAATHTDLIGAVADLADADDATRMGASAAADRQSFTLTGPTGPGTGTIAGVHVKLRAQRGTSGPTKVGGSLRIGGTDYDATTQTAATNAPGALFSTWTENPATTSAWTSGTLPTEAGLLTAT